MTVLAFETSATVASTAIVSRERVIAEVTINNKKTHSETLMPTVAAMFDCAGLSLCDITHIAAASGPGSFTGLRIGAATAKATAHALGLPLIPVPTLDALAYNVSNEQTIIAPIMDARRSQVYTAFFERQGGVMTRLTPPAAMDINECLTAAAAFGKPVIFLGDGVVPYEEVIRAVHGNFSIAPINCRMQSAACVGLYALDNPHLAGAYDELSIIYLRKPQAEREYENKLKKPCLA